MLNVLQLFGAKQELLSNIQISYINMELLHASNYSKMIYK